jgi:FK506-binding protein 1
MALARAREKREQDQKKNAGKEFIKNNVVMLKPGDACNFPKKGDSCSVHYKGFLENGTMFDNSYERGQPIYFILGQGQVISGWEEAMPIISLTEIARITLPPEYAYGDRGFPPVIPPNATVIYEIGDSILLIY